MKNILEEAKRGFLIIGLTGPLNSGCTTVAKFLRDDISTFISKKIAKAHALNKKIQQLYSDFADLRRRLHTNMQEHDTTPETTDISLDRELSKIFSDLKLLLEEREILSVLADHKDIKFKYISLSNVLLKLAAETADKTTSKIPEFEIFRSLIQNMKFDIQRACDVREKIRERAFGLLTKDDLFFYHHHLDSINELRERLKTQMSPHDLGKMLQDMGDNVRRCGNPWDSTTSFDPGNESTLFKIAREANDLIKFLRAKERKQYGLQTYNVFVLEAFRNPYEVAFFRNRYYEFFLMSLFADTSVRQQRGGWDPERDKRDRGENLRAADFYKQNVAECVYMSDIAITNNATIQELKNKVARYLALIWQPGCVRPTQEELFMHLAYSMSAMSSCISRQVGAVIVGQRGYVIGAGWNDVGFGQIGCGFRRVSDILSEGSAIPIAPSDEISRFTAFMYGHAEADPTHNICFKDVYSEFKIAQKSEMILNSPDIESWRSNHDVSKKALEQLSEIQGKNMVQKRLEYCRALHAEENAILQNAIIGGMGIQGSTIYTTTFPCELCAKKIYQAGIRRLVYTEPYPKSISKDVFFQDGMHIVDIVQFEGVKSHSFYRLYRPDINRKDYIKQITTISSDK